MCNFRMLWQSYPPNYKNTPKGEEFHILWVIETYSKWTLPWGPGTKKKFLEQILSTVSSLPGPLLKEAVSTGHSGKSSGKNALHRSNGDLPNLFREAWDGGSKQLFSNKSICPCFHAFMDCESETKWKPTTNGGQNLTSKEHFQSATSSHTISTSLLSRKNNCSYNVNDRQFCFLLLNDLCFNTGIKGILWVEWNKTF